MMTLAASVSEAPNLLMMLESTFTIIISLKMATVLILYFPLSYAFAHGVTMSTISPAIVKKHFLHSLSPFASGRTLPLLF
jgi:hypothetical protein